MDGNTVKPLLLDFAADASLEDVLEAVRIAYDRAGCSPCGRLSLMIRAVEVWDPGIERLRSVGSLRSVAELETVVTRALPTAG